MKTYCQAIHLWIAAGIFFLNMLLPGGISAQSVPQSAGKDPGSQNQAHMGIDVSEFTEVDGLGFLSVEEVKPWGHLFSDETERVLLARGDTVYVVFEEGHDIKPGDLYTVFNSSSELDHPLTGRDLGYVVSFMGRVVLKREVKPHVFKAEIVECYRPMQMGDPVLPFQPVSPCVQLSGPEPKTSDPSKPFKIPVVAAKDLRQVIGQFSVLYMNHGHVHGIRRGNLFQIVSRGEPDQPEEPALPDQVIGYLLVLESRPGTSTGLVITAKREFYSGTMLKAIHLKEVLKGLLTHYGLEHDETDLENHPLHVLNRLAEAVGSRADLPEAFILLSKMPKCIIK
ncbi:MAG: hypothetical protein R6X27_13405 [Candidatus Desulfacyla sp.]